MSTKIGIIKNLYITFYKSGILVYIKKISQLKNDLVLKNFPKHFINRILTVSLKLR